MAKRATVYDIADALGISAGTVHRALHDYVGINPATKKRVLQMAKTLGYRPNLAARYLSQKRKLRVSIITLKGTTSFWDEVRAGVEEEAKSLDMEGVEVEFRTYPSLGEGDEDAFEAALEAKADGVITFPSRPGNMRKWIRRAARSKVPVICVVTDAPKTGRLAVVSIDTLASGSLAADLLGKFLRGQGRVAVTMSALVITEHAEKFNAFKDTLQKFYPAMQIEDAIEDHDIEAEAYDKSKKLFAAHPDLGGLYITTEASIPGHPGGSRCQRSGQINHHHHRSVPRARRRNSQRLGCCDDLPAPANAGPHGLPRPARIFDRRRMFRLPGHFFAAPGDARKFGVLPARTIVRSSLAKKRPPRHFGFSIDGAETIARSLAEQTSLKRRS